jgi:hypothetical protein
MPGDDISDTRPPAAGPPKRDKLTRSEAARWLEENADKIESWNRWVAAHGLPLARWRQF